MRLLSNWTQKDELKWTRQRPNIVAVNVVRCVVVGGCTLDGKKKNAETWTKS